jgi:hypothetical protein
MITATSATRPHPATNAVGNHTAAVAQEEGWDSSIWEKEFHPRNALPPKNDGSWYQFVKTQIGNLCICYEFLWTGNGFCMRKEEL